MNEFNNQNNRINNDLGKVFDRKWQANYKTSEKISNNMEAFNKKMFNIKDKDEIRKEMRDANTVNSKVDRLNKKMEGLQTNNRSKFW